MLHNRYSVSHFTPIQNAYGMIFFLGLTVPCNISVIVGVCFRYKKGKKEVLK